eukprot:CAMPEP_0175889368 /NCGR_PEP_ID=MMETSP0107_2-20121207/47225_1 /TAXON_ID=195067 ORGANISM="Goniomonas pacifica, Strain CCMP1869" /NCGR_SAMPLE_ID=MMETSP0107_2 /ASSEMBLY_ACC=CAM_ASM_000203 /LENGTH=94 /DNA_ID=CAMNT_0017209997 /DNA_START=72 /DNA_END=356 /DNA_ORIENTATION=-
MAWGEPMVLTLAVAVVVSWCVMNPKNCFLNTLSIFVKPSTTSGGVDESLEKRAYVARRTSHKEKTVVQLKRHSLQNELLSHWNLGSFHSRTPGL